MWVFTCCHHESLFLRGRRKLLFPTQILKLLLHCTLQLPPLLLPLFSHYVPHISSIPLASVLLFHSPLLYTPLAPPASALGCCDVFVYSTTPPLMSSQYLGFSPSISSFFLFTSSNHTEASVFGLPACRQQGISPLCWGLFLEREAVLQVNCAFVSIHPPQLNNLTP